tara:strand:- start:1753 stop:2379 length:627 start_codon:yes stop_codon:yes gene_type:complete
MTDLDMKMTPEAPMSNPASDQSKGVINDVLNQKAPEPLLEAPDPLVTAPLLLKEIIADEDVFNDVPPPEKRPKKKISEKQLEHLAKAREKAKETRRLKAEAKKDLKITQKPRRESVSFSDDEVLSKDSAPIHTKQEYPSFQQFTPEDIIKLQEDAINSYDKKRKARKEVKKQQKQVEAVEKKNYEAVTRAIHHPTNPSQDDPWAMCFN